MSMTQRQAVTNSRHLHVDLMIYVTIVMTYGWSKLLIIADRRRLTSIQSTSKLG